jgi:predicted ArsR family transcriptional regulator
MVLSTNGDQPMTKLSDTQTVILSAASQRDDGAVLPLPETLKIRGGAVDKVLGSLKAKGLIDRRGSRRGDNPPPLRITRAGLAAIGIETDDAPEGATPAEAETATDAPVPVAKADVAARPAKKSKPAKGKATATNTARAQKPTPGARSKQALMIELLKRPSGATVEQIAAATGWQHHTIRGAISGALRKKLGLTIETIRTRAVGANKTGAKGSRTVYRITGSGPEAGPPPAVG